jgi:hypothetical protein
MQQNNKNPNLIRRNLIKKNLILNKLAKYNLIKNRRTKQTIKPIINNNSNLIKPINNKEVKPKKIALICGSNYKNTKYPLNGCLNDCKNISTELIKNGFNVTLLTDETKFKPNKNNIISILISLISTLNSGDIFMFHFSGHGTQTAAGKTFREKDGLDELICTIEDNNTISFIFDNEFNSILQNGLKNKNNISMLFLFDCCHSCSMLDLKYTYNSINKKFDIEDTNVDNRQTINSNNRIVCFTGCADKQESLDVGFSKNNEVVYGGLFTINFLQALQSVKNGSISTYTQLIDLVILLVNKNNNKPQLASNIDLLNITIPNYNIIQKGFFSNN